MNLKDVISLFGTTVVGKDNFTAVVFSGMEDADNFVRKYFNPALEKEYEILFTIHSEFEPSMYLKEEMLNKKVEWIQAIARDVFVIVIDSID